MTRNSRKLIQIDSLPLLLLGHLWMNLKALILFFSPLCQQSTKNNKRKSDGERDDVTLGTTRCIVMLSAPMIRWTGRRRWNKMWWHSTCWIRSEGGRVGIIGTRFFMTLGLRSLWEGVLNKKVIPQNLLNEDDVWPIAATLLGIHRCHLDPFPNEIDHTKWTGSVPHPR